MRETCSEQFKAEGVELRRFGNQMYSLIPKEILRTES